MRTRVLLGLMALAVVTAAFGAVYFLGYVRFNYPNPHRFPVRGIDISHHQGSIDWDLLKKEGVDFVYMKATEGSNFKDPAFAKNWEEASRLKIVRGAYHFFTFCRPGREQAENFIQTVPVEPLTLPPVIDFELAGNCAKRPRKEDLLAEVRNFILLVQNRYGQRPIFYVTYKSYETYLQGEIDPYDIWIRDIFWFPRLPDGKRWMFWQYAHRGRLGGVDGPVDLDVFNGTMEEFTMLLRHNTVHEE